MPIINEALSKKYYKLIAEAIRTAKNVDALAMTLADIFADDNQNFRREQFLKAAGVKEKKNPAEGEIKKEASQSTPMQCNECGKKFKKKIGPKTFEVKCPKCGGYDTEPA